MTMPTGAAQALTFLAARFPELAEGETIEIRPFANGKLAGRRWCRSAAEAARYVVSLGDRCDVYYGVNPRRGHGGAKGDVAHVLQLHADVDFKHYPDGRDGALVAIQQFPLIPTYVVESGGGLQVGYALAAPIPIAEAADPAVARIEGLLRRLYQALGGLDAVQDISRIFRVPGTSNRKYDPPRPVMLLRHEDDRRYSLEQLERLLPPLPPAAIPAPIAAPARPARSDAPSLDDLRAMLRCIPPTGDYQDHWLKILMAVADAYPGPEGVALCEEWSPGHPGEVAKKFASFRRQGGATVGVGTLLHTAKQYGWRPERPAPPAPVHSLTNTPPPAPETPACGAQDASHSRPDLSAVPEEVRAYLAQMEARCARLEALEAENAALREENQRLRGERNEERERFRTRFQVLHNQTLKSSTRLAAVAVADLLEDAERKGKIGEDGKAPLYLAAVAEQAGLNERSVGPLVEELAELGFIEKETILHRRSVPTADGGTRSVLATEIRAGAAGGSVTVALHRVALTAAPARGHGGKRTVAKPKPWRCPEHPDAPHVVSCTVCGQRGDEREIAAASEMVDQLVGCGAQDAPHNGSTDGSIAVTRMVPPPVEVSIKQAQDAPHDPASVGTSGWTGARSRAATSPASPARWQQVSLCLACGEPLPPDRAYYCPACTPTAAEGGT